jgi:hypothetical protein
MFESRVIRKRQGDIVHDFYLQMSKKNRANLLVHVHDPLVSSNAIRQMLADEAGFEASGPTVRDWRNRVRAGKVTV